MALCGAGIAEGLSFLRNELPVVAFGMQREFQHAEGIGVVCFAVGLHCCEESVRVLAAASYNEFANAVFGIRLSVRVLRCKALVIVIMAIDHNVGAGVVQNVPKRLNLGIGAVRQARTEKRLVKVSQCAASGMLLQVCLHPFGLRRVHTAPAHFTTLAIQRKDVPLPEVITVVAVL